MYHYDDYGNPVPHSHPAPHPQPYNPGIVGIVGGVINLTTTALYGGARVVRTIVEGSVWHGEHPYHHHGCCAHQHHGCHHACHVHCCPENYSCCGCC
ncbi:MAG: hypothetical protein PVJ39_14495 [Gammaproteobacteria bacterium]|jgi:hypothetical protein